MSTMPASELVTTYALGAAMALDQYGDAAPILSVQYDGGNALTVQLARPDAEAIAQVVATLLMFLPRSTHVTVVVPLAPDDPGDPVALVVSMDLTVPGRGAWRTITPTTDPDGSEGYLVEGDDDNPGGGVLVELVAVALAMNLTADAPPEGTTLIRVLGALGGMGLIVGAMTADPRIES
jgi:hypothetical protein